MIGERVQEGVLKDIRFIPDQIMYDTLSEGKRRNNNTQSKINGAAPSLDLLVHVGQNTI